MLVEFSFYLFQGLELVEFFCSTRRASSADCAEQAACMRDMRFGGGESECAWSSDVEATREPSSIARSGIISSDAVEVAAIGGTVFKIS